MTACSAGHLGASVGSGQTDRKSELRRRAGVLLIVTINYRNFNQVGCDLTMDLTSPCGGRSSKAALGVFLRSDYPPRLRRVRPARRPSLGKTW